MVGVPGTSGVVRGLAVLAGLALLAGCGGSSTPAPGAHSSHASHASSPAPRASGAALAERVCGGARQAASTALGSPLSAHIVNPAAASLQCVLTGQVRVSVGSQAGTRAYTEFDTETAHQEQVYGNGGVHDPSQFPTPITVPGSVVAVWIPAQKLLVATDATPTTGGAYVTVAVSGHAAPAKVALRVAAAAARATFAAHPDGPS